MKSCVNSQVTSQIDFPKSNYELNIELFIKSQTK